jgi:hypothetical protein
LEPGLRLLKYYRKASQTPKLVPGHPEPPQTLDNDPFKPETQKRGHLGGFSPFVGRVQKNKRFSALFWVSSPGARKPGRRGGPGGGEKCPAADNFSENSVAVCGKSSPRETPKNPFLKRGISPVFPPGGGNPGPVYDGVFLAGGVAGDGKPNSRGH